jgi:hypothetical protein
MSEEKYYGMREGVLDGKPTPTDRKLNDVEKVK